MCGSILTNYFPGRNLQIGLNNTTGFETAAITHNRSRTKLHITLYLTTTANDTVNQSRVMADLGVIANGATIHCRPCFDRTIVTND